MKRKVLNTRPANSDDAFEAMLRENNFDVVNFPVIEIIPVTDFSETDTKLDNIAGYDCLIFTSGNAVKIFLERAAAKNIRIGCRIFSVGEKTKMKIGEFGYTCEELPEKSDSAALAELIEAKYGKDKKYLFPKGRIGMNKIPTFLPNVDEVVVYDTLPSDNPDGIEDVGNMLYKNEVDCLVFFSPSAVKNFSALFHGFKQGNTAVAVIGETTRKRAEAAGLRVNITPARYTSEELAKEIIKYFNG